MRLRSQISFDQVNISQPKLRKRQAKPELLLENLKTEDCLAPFRNAICNVSQQREEKNDNVKK